MIIAKLCGRLFVQETIWQSNMSARILIYIRQDVDLTVPLPTILFALLACSHGILFSLSPLLQGVLVVTLGVTATGLTAEDCSCSSSMATLSLAAWSSLHSWLRVLLMPGMRVVLVRSLTAVGRVMCSPATIDWK